MRFTSLFLLLFGFLFLYRSGASAQIQNPRDTLVLLQTSFGDIKIKLYKETPLHRANMLKLVGEGFYDSTTFHRIISNFMIQGGDPNTKDTVAANDGQGGVPYMIPAEFNNKFIHKRGAVAGARIPNPGMKSSGCQFYIVVGAPVGAENLPQFLERSKQNFIQENMQEVQAFAQQLLQKPENAWFMTSEFQQLRASDPDSARRAESRLNVKIVEEYLAKHFPYKYTPAAVQAYTELGGTPHLDFNYTVFGEVVSGMDVVDKIVSQPKNRTDRPLKDIKMTAKLLYN